MGQKRFEQTPHQRTYPDGKITDVYRCVFRELQIRPMRCHDIYQKEQNPKPQQHQTLLRI